ncbi:MAG: hypothetical protein QOI55_2452 [Actinomycetota bacterium]|nr:hypothetical protein [Actinomycetota bacterium]
MASADTLDDLWREGLDALAETPRYSPEPRERTTARAAQRRRRRAALQGLAVLCVVAAASVGAFTVARNDGGSRFASDAGPEAQPVYVTFDGATLDVSPRTVHAGPVEVTLQNGLPLTLALPDNQVIDATTRCRDCIRTASFRAADGAHYQLTAIVNGAQVASAQVDVVAPYVEPKGDPIAVREIEALPSLRYEPNELTMPPGIIELRLRDQIAGQHALTIEGLPGFLIVVNNAGEVKSGKVELAPGRYTFHCTIPGHRQAGMEGTLIVQGR